MGKSTKKATAMQDLAPVSLGELIHTAIRRAIETTVHEELEAALGAAPYERTGARRGYRNGKLERTLTGPAGPVPLTLPRATLRSRSEHAAEDQRHPQPGTSGGGRRQQRQQGGYSSPLRCAAQLVGQREGPRPEPRHQQGAGARHRRHPVPAQQRRLFRLARAVARRRGHATGRGRRAGGRPRAPACRRLAAVPRARATAAGAGCWPTGRLTRCTSRPSSGAARCTRKSGRCAKTCT